MLDRVLSSIWIGRRIAVVGENVRGGPAVGDWACAAGRTSENQFQGIGKSPSPNTPASVQRKRFTAIPPTDSDDRRSAFPLPSANL